MPYYRIMLNGTGIRIVDESSTKSIGGFFTTRIVRAATSELAAKSALEGVALDWNADGYSEASAGNPLSLSIEEVSQTTLWRYILRRPAGYMFYSENEHE